jgi:hypothetical protein
MHQPYSHTGQTRYSTHMERNNADLSQEELSKDTQKKKKY